MIALLALFGTGTLETLPGSLETEIGEGQRQQIARILVDRPRILVLDQATANLDYATELAATDRVRRLVCSTRHEKSHSTTWQ